MSLNQQFAAIVSICHCAGGLCPDVDKVTGSQILVLRLPSASVPTCHRRTQHELYIALALYSKVSANEKNPYHRYCGIHHNDPLRNALNPV